MRRIGWTCRACDRGDHRWCEVETNGVPCVCTEGICGIVTPEEDNDLTTTEYLTVMTLAGLVAGLVIVAVT